MILGHDVCVPVGAVDMAGGLTGAGMFTAAS
jgi:hypothetical protein